MVNDSKDRIIAYVSPKSIGGQSLFSPNASLDSGHIAHYLSEKKVVRSASCRSATPERA